MFVCFDERPTYPNGNFSKLSNILADLIDEVFSIFLSCLDFKGVDCIRFFGDTIISES